RQALQGQWLARQYDRQSARHHDRPVEADLRGHARQVPEPESLRCARRRLSAVLRAALEPRLLRVAGKLQPGHRAQEEADRVPEPALFRRAGVHAGSAAPPGGAGRRQPGRARHRSPDPVGAASGRPYLRDRHAERRREDRDPRRQRGAPPRHEADLMDKLLPLAETVAARLIARKETVAVAESSTGGLIAAALLAVPGASAYFLGGAVVYTAASRSALVGITPADMTGMRASTEPYAAMLAKRICDKHGATWAISETGAAGPTGNRYGDAAGHSCIAIAGPVQRT